MASRYDIDVTMVIEGAYPYVHGGVSEWVHQLVTHLSNYRFAIIFLGSTPEEYGPAQYELPANVVELQSYYLFAQSDNHMATHSPARLNKTQCSFMRTLHERVFNKENTDVDNLLVNINEVIGGPDAIGEHEFLHGYESWRYINELYESNCPNDSFTTYFWNVRSMHKPLWRFKDIVDKFPQTSVIHTITTGYAGLLACMAAQRHNRPLLLTEHGIYTKERRIEIISEAMASSPIISPHTVGLNYFHEMWLNYFEFLAWVCYRKAQLIVSLFELARRYEVEEGAQVDKTRVLGNGVDVEHIKQLRQGNRSTNVITVATLGKVVMIKDTKTFIRSIQQIIEHSKQPIQAWIIGNINEQPEYVEQCRQLIQSLELNNHVSIKGRMPLNEILPNIDVMVMSSISEGQPYSILEAMAAGIPTVATDVGACKELIYGGELDDDQMLGQAGRVARVGDATTLAQGAIELINDPELWQQASEAAYERAKRFYRVERVIEAYDQFYQELIESWQASD